MVRELFSSYLNLLYMTLILMGLSVEVPRTRRVVVSDMSLLTLLTVVELVPDEEVVEVVARDIGTSTTLFQLAEGEFCFA